MQGGDEQLINSVPVTADQFLMRNITALCLDADDDDDDMTCHV